MSSEYLQEIRAQIQAEVDQADLPRNLARIEAEQLSRNIVKAKPVVLTWDADTEDSSYFGLKPPPGSLTLFWALKGSRTMRELEYAYVAQDVQRLQELHDRLVADHKSRSVISIAEATDRALGAPSFFEFRFNGKLLAQNLWLADDAECGTVLLPYSGGPIDETAFTIVEYSQDLSEPAYEALIVICPPRLSEIEQRALATVPMDSQEAHIAPMGLVMATPTTIVSAALFVASVTVATTCCSPFHDRLAEVSLPLDVAERVGARTSVRQLLRLRADIFEEFGVM